MKTNLKIFCGLSIFAIIAVANIAHAATTPVVNNKTSQFNDVLSEMGASATDSSNAALAETIRRQRALLDAAGDTGATATGGTNITTANACDAALRKCMSEKCGADFTKCASDSTTVWGNKMDACRRNTKCTGHEYTLLAPEILADRDAAIELSYYNSVVNCGNRYNNCVFGICGKSLENCLSKSAGDSAIAKCKSIADECREQDSGLAARVMGVFGDRRNIAATEAQRDEKRLYELRDLMRTQCTRFGAMFDERTLDCVYTVNFFAGTDNTLMASKKLYSGDTFQCTPDWFGVDITTYMENAQRLTRSQTSASAAAMGAGLGTAASLWTSGAVTRGIDTQNAEKQAKEKCIEAKGEWVSAGFNKGNKCDMTNAEQNCTNSGGTWNGTGCTRAQDLSNGGGRNPGATPIEEKIKQTQYCMRYNEDPVACNNDPKCQYNEDLCERKEGAPTETSSNGGGRNPGATPIEEKIKQTQYCMRYNEDPVACNNDPKCQYNEDLCERKEGAPTETSSNGGGSNPEKPQNNGSVNGNSQCDSVCRTAITQLTAELKKFTSTPPMRSSENPRIIITDSNCYDQCKTMAQSTCEQNLLNKPITLNNNQTATVKRTTASMVDNKLVCALIFKNTPTNTQYIKRVHGIVISAMDGEVLPFTTIKCTYNGSPIPTSGETYCDETTSYYGIFDCFNVPEETYCTFNFTGFNPLKASVKDIIGNQNQVVMCEASSNSAKEDNINSCKIDKKRQTVNISTTIQTKDGNIIPEAKIICDQGKKSGTSNSKGKITIRSVPSYTTCLIKADGCTDTAELAYAIPKVLELTCK